MIKKDTIIVLCSKDKKMVIPGMPLQRKECLLCDDECYTSMRGNYNPQELAKGNDMVLDPKDKKLKFICTDCVEDIAKTYVATIASFQGLEEQGVTREDLIKKFTKK